MKQQVNYTNHSKDAFVYHWLVVNGDQFDGFSDECYDRIVDDLKKSGNERLFNSANDEELREVGEKMYDRIWDGY